MEKISLIYSFHSNKSAKIADKIKEALGNDLVEPINAESLTEEEFLRNPLAILGVPTWFDGELPNYWDEFGPALEDLDLKDRKYALYGLGDQKGYPDNFMDAMGILSDLLQKRGAQIIGYTSAEGYTFSNSKAVRDNKFCGLAIDFENQATQNNSRVKSWVEQLKKELE